MNWNLKILIWARNFDPLSAILSKGQGGPAFAAIATTHGDQDHGFGLIDGHAVLLKEMKNPSKTSQQQIEFGLGMECISGLSIVSVQVQMALKPIRVHLLRQIVEQQHGNTVPEPWSGFASLPNPQKSRNGLCGSANLDMIGSVPVPCIQNFGQFSTGTQTAESAEELGTVYGVECSTQIDENMDGSTDLRSKRCLSPTVRSGAFSGH